MGDALVLLTRARPEAPFGPLLATLHERRFLRSVSETTDPLATLYAQCAQTRTGCRVALESEWLAHTPALLVTCAAHAHLSLALVVERTHLFEAHALGRITASGLSIAVDGVSIAASL